MRRRSVLERSRLLGMAAAAAPVAAVLLARGAETLDSAPASASAHSEPAANLERLSSLLSSSPNAEQSRAIEFASQARDEPFGPSPFYQPKSDKEEPPPEPSDVEKPEPSDDDVSPTPTFAVTSVMAGGRRPLATINGELCQVGDKIEQGWTVIDINGQTGRVRLEGPNGTIVTARLQRLRDRVDPSDDPNQ